MDSSSHFNAEPTNTNPVRGDKDKRKAECPYCHKSLSKIPGRRTKCPYCGEFMFVRTRPVDRVRVVVTKEETEHFEQDWLIIGGAQDEVVLSEDEESAKAKEILKKQLGGREPSKEEILWKLLNDELLEHAKNRDWGLYRNTRLDMATVLRGRMNLDEALQIYLEVCYLDLNGPSNSGRITLVLEDGTRETNLVEASPFFHSADAFLAPEIIATVRQIASRLRVVNDSIKKVFIEHNSPVWQSLRLPLSPEQCWISLDKELGNYPLTSRPRMGV